MPITPKNKQAIKKYGPIAPSNKEIRRMVSSANLHPMIDKALKKTQKLKSLFNPFGYIDASLKISIRFDVHYKMLEEKPLIVKAAKAMRNKTGGGIKRVKDFIYSKLWDAIYSQVNYQVFLNGEVVHQIRSNQNKMVRHFDMLLITHLKAHEIIEKKLKEWFPTFNVEFSKEAGIRLSKERTGTEFSLSSGHKGLAKKIYSSIKIGFYEDMLLDFLYQRVMENNIFFSPESFEIFSRGSFERYVNELIDTDLIQPIIELFQDFLEASYPNIFMWVNNYIAKAVLEMLPQVIKQLEPANETEKSESNENSANNEAFHITVGMTKKDKHPPLPQEPPEPLLEDMPSKPNSKGHSVSFSC